MEYLVNKNKKIYKEIFSQLYEDAYRNENIYNPFGLKYIKKGNKVLI